MILKKIKASDKRGLFDESGWLRVAVSLLVIISGLVALPAARPVLPVETFIRIYGKSSTKNNVERLALANLPQFYADRFGWQENRSSGFRNLNLG